MIEKVTAFKEPTDSYFQQY